MFLLLGSGSAAQGQPGPAAGWAEARFQANIGGTHTLLPFANWQLSLLRSCAKVRPLGSPSQTLSGSSYHHDLSYPESRRSGWLQKLLETFERLRILRTKASVVPPIAGMPFWLPWVPYNFQKSDWTYMGSPCVPEWAPFGAPEETGRHTLRAKTVFLQKSAIRMPKTALGVGLASIRPSTSLD